METFQVENLKKQFIYDAKGKPEYIVLAVSDYEHLVELLEDHVLGKAMDVAESSPRYERLEALKFLENDTD